MIHGYGSATIMRGLIAVVLWLLFLGAPVSAQNSSAGMTPSGTARSISVTTTSSSVQLNGSGTTVIMWNVGAVEAFYAVGGGAAAPTATTASYSLPAGGVITLNLPPTAFIAAILQAARLQSV